MGWRQRRSGSPCRAGRTFVGGTGPLQRLSSCGYPQAADLACAAVESPGWRAHLEQGQLARLSVTWSLPGAGARLAHAALETSSMGSSSPRQPQWESSSLQGTHHSCRSKAAPHEMCSQARTPSAWRTKMPWQPGCTLLVVLTVSLRLQDHMEASMRRGWDKNVSGVPLVGL